MKHIIIPILLGFTLWSCQSQDTQEAAPSPKPDGVSQPAEIVSPTRSEDWPMFMHDLNFSGRSSDQHLKPPLKLRWKFKTGGPIIGSVAVAYGTVYVGSEDRKLYALDAKNWGIRWTFQTGGAQSGTRQQFGTAASTPARETTGCMRLTLIRGHWLGNTKPRTGWIPRRLPRGEAFTSACFRTRF